MTSSLFSHTYIKLISSVLYVPWFGSTCNYGGLLCIIELLHFGCVTFSDILLRVHALYVLELYVHVHASSKDTFGLICPKHIHGMHWDVLGYISC